MPLLFVGGRLATEPPVGSAWPAPGEGLALFVRVAGLDASDTHRSVYLPVVRDQVLESLALFDFADPSLVTGERATTTGPAQALYFMNGPFVIRQAEALADRLARRRGRRAPADRSGVSARLRASADGRGAGPRPRVPSRLRSTRRRRPSRHARPGRRSARHSSPAPSFDIWIELIRRSPSQHRLEDRPDECPTWLSHVATC